MVQSKKIRHGLDLLRLADLKGSGADPDIETLPDRLNIQVAQLLRFLDWLLPIVFCFALIEGAVFALFRDPGSGITGATLFVYGTSLLVAKSQAYAGDWRPAVTAVCAGFLVACLIIVAAQPSLVTVIILAPLLAVGVALIYASEKTLRHLFAAAWFVTIAVAALGEIIPSRSRLPGWYESTFQIMALAAAVTIVLLLLWQFRSHLMGALAQARAAEAQAMHDATHDPLTGLPNRALLMERLARTLERQKKEKDYLFALLFLDLDRFKNVNDSLGHITGDSMLIEISRRLESCVRPTDTVARLGGDEFTILLEGVKSADEVKGISDRLLKALQVPFKVGDHELYSSASIGVVLKPTDYQRPEDLLRDADTAMYRAKDGGKGRYEVFDVQMRTKAVNLLRLEISLRQAVERREFVVHYQPIISLRSGEITGFEALARWKHPERGMISPAEFIPLAEETGLIIPIDLHVLREACSTMSAWHSKFPCHRPLSMSVNLSAAQLARPELTDQLKTMLRESGLSGRHLCLEITESTIMRDPELAAETLLNLRRLGIRVHIDDFGTGYSSLGMLHRFPVDALKVDQSFVRDMGARGKPSENEQIVRAITTLAHSLGMDVIAEGIEARDHLQQLREIGCDYGQGYCFSRPVEAPAAEEIIAVGARW